MIICKKIQVYPYFFYGYIEFLFRVLIPSSSISRFCTEEGTPVLESTGSRDSNTLNFHKFYHSNRISLTQTIFPNQSFYSHFRRLIIYLKFICYSYLRKNIPIQFKVRLNISYIKISMLIFVVIILIYFVICVAKTNLSNILAGVSTSSIGSMSAPITRFLKFSV